MKTLALIIFIALILMGCDNRVSVDIADPNETLILGIHQSYLDGWQTMDKEKVMNLMEENAIIQPNSFPPVQGKKNIENFWFPEDGSTTRINQFTTELINLEIFDTLAVTTHTSLLDWTYQKDSINIDMLQSGFNTTVYRKQHDNSWKIWRSMWTDIFAQNQ